MLCFLTGKQDPLNVEKIFLHFFTKYFGNNINFCYFCIAVI